MNQVIALYFPEDSFFKSTTSARYFEELWTPRSAREYALLSIASHDPANPTMASVFSRGDVDGIVSMANPEEFGKVVKILRAEINFGRRPAVSVIHPVDDCAAVVTDDYSGGYASASHLLDLGHRHILHFVVGKEVYPYYERLKGYRQAYIDRGLDPNQYLRGCLWHKETDPSPGLPGPDELVMPVLREHPEITAILARTDVIAVRTSHSLSKHGLKVPDDISVVGFDDTEPLTNDRGVNILTTVRLPLRDVGHTAAGQLIRMITGEQKGNCRTVLPVEFVVRNSTAPPRQRS